MHLATAGVVALNGASSSMTMLHPAQRKSPCTSTIAIMVSLSVTPRLKRVYILFNGEHGLNEFDRIMLQSLEEKSQSPEIGGRWTLQAIITKADTMSGDVRAAIQKVQRDIFETAPLCLPGIVTANSKNVHIGIDNVRRSMVEACGLGRM